MFWFWLVLAIGIVEVADGLNDFRKKQYGNLFLGSALMTIGVLGLLGVLPS